MALGLILRIPDLDRGAATGAAATGPCSAWRSRASARSSSVPELRGITVAAAIGLGGLGLMTVTFPLFAVEHLGGERSDAGYMWAAFAAGSTLGALSLVRLQRRFPPERIVLAGYAIFGALMLTWPLAGSLPVLLALIAARRARRRPGARGAVRGAPAGRPAVALRPGVHDRGRPEGRLVRDGRRAGGAGGHRSRLRRGDAGGRGARRCSPRVVGVTLMRMPARALPQASPGG